MNIMIVDDEKHARNRLVELVSDIPGCYVKACSQNGLEAVEKVGSMDIDVVLLDIHMPVMGGLEAARQMNKNANSPHIIFTTAYRQHAFSAFEVNARGFLLKPIERHQLREKLGQLRRLNTTRYVREAGQYTRRSHIYCRLANRLELISLDDVIYFRSEQKYTMVKHINGIHLIDETLKYLEQEFGDILMRVHRSVLVNKVYMQRLHRDKEQRIQLGFKCTDDKLYLSRRYVTRVRAYLKQFSPKFVNV